MSGENQVTILGSGTSTGIPMPGCHCSVCESSDSRDKRLRSSILITTKNKKNILVDTSPDLRTQALRSNIDMVDAAIITHEHADHLHGIDDLRPYCFIAKKEIPLYTHSLCAETMRVRYPYIFDKENLFKGKRILGGGLPSLSLNIVQKEEIICGLNFKFFLLPHGHVETLGFICENTFAYFIDCQGLTKEVLDACGKLNLELLILDCVKEEPHETHLNFKRALHYAHLIKAKKTRLIHMGHELSHEGMIQKLQNEPLDIAPTFDLDRYLF